MKPHKLFISFIICSLLMCSAKVLAFDSNSDCLKTLTYKSAGFKALQEVLNNYTDTAKYSKKLEDGTYTLCFETDTSYCLPQILPSCPSPSFTITASATAPLLIYGLNLSTTLTTGALLTFTGSNITLDHATLTGAGSGTAIQIAQNVTNIAIQNLTSSNFLNGLNFGTGTSNVTISNSSVSGTGSGIGVLALGVDYSIISNTIQKFDTGIQIGNANTEGANITVKDSNLGTAGNVVTTGINLVNATNLKTEGLTFNIKDGGHNIIPAWTFDIVAKRCETTVKSADGKHDICDTTKEDNKVVKIAGKPPIEETGCGTGKSVEVYKRLIDGTKELVLNCNLSQDVEAKILIGQDEYEIKKGDCAFSCEAPADKQLNVNDIISLKYKLDPNSVASDGLIYLADLYKQTIAISELPNLYTLVTMPPIDMPTSPQGGDGVTSVYTGDPASFDPGNPKAQTGDTSNNDDDGGGQVSQGSGGCSLIR